MYCVVKEKSGKYSIRKVEVGKPMVWPNCEVLTDGSHTKAVAQSIADQNNLLAKERNKAILAPTDEIGRWWESLSPSKKKNYSREFNTTADMLSNTQIEFLYDKYSV